LFWNITKIIENKFRAIPVLKMDGLTLLTESEKANAIASKFSLAHENSDVFSDDSSSYTSPLEIKNIIKKLKDGQAPDCDGVPNRLLKNIPRKATVFLT
jgi:hypothetical protein